MKLLSYEFNSTGKPPNCLHCGCTILHSHQRCIEVPVALHPHQYLVLSVPGGVCFSHSNRWLVSVVLICVSLMMWSIFSGAYLPPVYLLQQSFSSNRWPIFYWVVFLLLSFESSFCNLHTNPLSDMWSSNIFFQSAIFHSPHSIFQRAEVFN